MPKAVFVGQQPSSYEDEGKVLPVRPGSSGFRLIKMMSIDESSFRRNFDAVNLSPFYDPDGFSPEYHYNSANNLLSLLEGRRIILLGPAVAQCFGIDRSRYQFCQFFDHPEKHDFHGLFCVIPHPSGANRLYNDPSMYEMVSNTLKMLWQISLEPERINV